MTTNPTSVDVHPADGGQKPPRPLSAGRFAALLVGALAITVIALYVAGHSGGTLEQPVGADIWQIAMTMIAIGIIGYGAVQSVRLGKLSRVLLIAIATGSAFWQETYGDWGTYLLYSPRFLTYDWGQTPYSSPVQCWWFIPGYVFFYTTFFLALEKAYQSIKAHWTSVNPLLATTLVSFPLFYIFDIALEGTAHGFGWWQYQYAFGPTMAIGSGHFPLLWPILEQVPFMVLAVWALNWRNADGEDVFEVIAHRVLRRRPGQLAILLSWIVSVNVVFLVTTIAPLMLVRILAGPASAVVP